MSYLGNTPTTQSFISGTDYFNGTGAQTAFTLSRTVASVNDIQAVVNNVVQVPNDAYTISGTTITFTSAPSAGTQNVYVRYLSTTTQAITPSQNTVSWSTLDTNTQQDLGINNKNRIINGNMAIDQRNAGASINNDTSGTQFSLDRWLIYGVQASKFSVQQNAGSVTPPVGFANYLGVTSLSAYSVGAGDFFTVIQRIEGFNFADCNWGTANAKTVTLSFWVRSSLTGSFGGTITNNDASRSYPFSYTISSANTWEQKSITVAGDTTGTWVGATNGTGVQVRFGLGSGATYTGTANTWAGTYYNQPTGTTSVVGTNGATFYITGVQLEVGTQATTFTTAGGSYGAELALCQRYFQLFGSISTPATNVMLGGAMATSSTGGMAVIGLVQELRSSPSLTFSSTASAFRVVNSTDSSIACNAVPTANILANKAIRVSFGVASGLTAGNATILFGDNSNAAWIGVSSEL